VNSLYAKSMKARVVHKTSSGQGDEMALHGTYRVYQYGCADL